MSTLGDLYTRLDDIILDELPSLYKVCVGGVDSGIPVLPCPACPFWRDFHFKGLGQRELWSRV